MGEFHLVIQFLHRGGAVVVSGDPVDKRVEPTMMTHGYRTVFWEVFREGWRVPLEAPIQVSWLGEALEITECTVLHSDRTCLDGQEGENFVSVLRVRTDGALDAVRSALERHRHDMGMSDLRVYRALREQIEGSRLAEFYDQLEFTSPDVKIVWEQPTEIIAPAVPYVLGFYYFGLLLVHRIDRAQAHIRLPLGAPQLSGASIETITATRVRLINIDRYFLTTNRSLSRDAKEFVIALVERINLAERYGRQTSINRNLERHLDNIAQMAQAKAARRTNLTLDIIAYLALPVGIFSAAVAFQLQSDMLRAPTLVLSSVRFWSALVASVLLPLAVILLARRVHALRDRNGSGQYP